MSKTIRLIKNIILSLAACYAVTRYISPAGTESPVSAAASALLLAAVCWLAFRRAPKGRRIKKYALIGAVPLSLTLVVGKSVNETNSIRPLFAGAGTSALTVLSLVGFVWLFFLLFARGFSWFARYRFRRPPGIDPKFFCANRRSLFIVWGFLFLCWIPCWLSYFPGIYSYDIHNQLTEIPITNFSPILHTLFAKFCLLLGGSSFGGIIVHSLLSMTLMSLVFSVSLRYMAGLKIRRSFRFLTLAWFAFNPAIVVFSFVETKDVFFGGVFLLLTLLVFDLVRDPKAFFACRRKQLALGGVCVLFCLLRNNAILSLALLSIAMLFFFRRYWRNVCCVLFGSVLVSGLCIGLLIPALGVQQTDSREALSLPLQQIALVAKDRWWELAQEDRVAIEKILPNDVDYSRYNPRLADPIKFQYYSDDPAKVTQMIKTWPRLFVQYPLDYIDAFLALNIGSWYPDTQMPNEYLHVNYIETNILGWTEVERESKLPWLNERYERFLRAAGQQKIPVVSLLYSIGTPPWFALIGILLCLVKKKRTYAAFFLPAVTLWLPYLAGPVSNFRFMFPLILTYPVLLAFLSTLVQDAAATRSLPAENAENDRN